MRRRLCPPLALVVAVLLLGRPSGLGSETHPATPAARVEAGVPMLGGNPARTGEQPGPGPAGAPAARWSFATGAELASAPALDGGAAYVSGDDGVLSAVETATGRERW